MYDEYIGLELTEAENLLRERNVKYSCVTYSDRKQTKFDKEIVTAVRQTEDGLQLVVCRYLFVAQ